MKSNWNYWGVFFFFWYAPGDLKYFLLLSSSWRARILMTVQSRLCWMNWRPWMTILRIMYVFILYLFEIQSHYTERVIFLFFWVSFLFFVHSFGHAYAKLLRIDSGSLHQWGKYLCCGFKFGPKAVPSSGGSWPLQELDYPWKLVSCPQLHEGMPYCCSLDNLC